VIGRQNPWKNARIYGNKGKALGKTAASSRKTFTGVGGYETTGEKMKYYCKKCGQKFEGANAMWSLLNMSCVERGGKHEPYEGRETGPYHCKKCGKEYDGPSAMWTLVHMSCPKGGKCEPF